MSAFTLYSLTIYFLWKHARRAWLRIAIVCIGLKSLSQIYLGVHYPSDIIGSYLMSAAWLVASISWYEHYLEE